MAARVRRSRAALLRDVVRYARAHVAMYRDLWGDAPEPLGVSGLRALPVLTSERRAATPIIEQIDTPSDTLRSWTPFRLQTVRSPVANLTDSADADAVYDQVRAAFAGVAGRRDPLAIVSPPEQRYVAAELAEVLGYHGRDVVVVVRLDDGCVARALAALGPRLVVDLGGQTRPWPGTAVTVRCADGDGPDLYLTPEAGIVAVRAAGETVYRVLTRWVHLESTDAGDLLVTHLWRYHQPLVRYLLRDRGRVAGGRLWLTDIAL